MYETLTFLFLHHFREERQKINHSLGTRLNMND